MKDRVTNDREDLFDRSQLRQTVIVDQFRHSRFTCNGAWRRESEDRGRAELKRDEPAPETQPAARVSDRIGATQRLQKRKWQKLFADAVRGIDEFVKTREIGRA